MTPTITGPYEAVELDRQRVSVGQVFRLAYTARAFGDNIDPTNGVYSPGPVTPGLYQVWRLDHGGQRVVLLALPARTGLSGPELYDERFVIVDLAELRKFRLNAERERAA